MYLLNATSLAKKNAVNLLYADAQAHNVDTVLISETWFNKQHSNDNVNLPGYQLYRHDRVKKGVVVCVCMFKMVSIVAKLRCH